MVLFWVCSKHTATRKITTCFHKLTQRQGCRRCDDAKSKLTKQRTAKCKDFLCALTPTFSQPPCSPLQGPQPLPFTPLQSHYKALSSMCIYVFVCACKFLQNSVFIVLVLSVFKCLWHYYTRPQRQHHRGCKSDEYRKLNVTK